MLPINHKQLVTGATWELRVKFKDDTKAKYHLLKDNYQLRHLQADRQRGNHSAPRGGRTTHAGELRVTRPSQQAWDDRDLAAR